MLKSALTGRSAVRLQVKNVERIELGKYEMETWYFSPLPAEFNGCKVRGDACAAVQRSLCQCMNLPACWSPGACCGSLLTADDAMIEFDLAERRVHTIV
jgi:hypothetical protein